jgi:hypothetical protein
MGLANQRPTEIDMERLVDLLISARSTADRGMGVAILAPTEIDTRRSIDLLISLPSTADRGMGPAIDSETHAHREGRDV